MAELNWSDDFLTGGINHAVTKAEDGLRLAPKPGVYWPGGYYYIEFPDALQLRLRDHPYFTIEAFVRSDGPVHYGTAAILSKGFDRDAGFLGLFVGEWNNPNTRYRFVGDWGTAQAIVNGPPHGQYAHVVGRSSPQAKELMVNGLKATASPFSSVVDTRPLIVGAMRNNWYQWHGLIQEVRFWHRYLTDSEVAFNRYRCLRGDEPGLVFLVRFEEGSGTTVRDDVGGVVGRFVGSLSWATGPKQFGARMVELDLSVVQAAQSHVIQWASTEPAGTGVSIETNLSLDGGRTWQGWQACANGGPIPGVTPGTDLSNARLKVWEHLHTTNPAAEPVLHRLTISIHSPVSVGRPRRVLPVRRSGRIHPVPHRGRVYPLA